MDQHRRNGLRRLAVWCGIAAAGALGAIASCAYYNIFWMAEQEYGKAVSKTAVADFWDPYSQPTPSGETLKNIDSCAKRCGKILLLYPKSKWVDDALIMMGNCFLIKGEYANAMRKYDEVINLYASSEFVQEARYMKAYTHVLEDDPGEALALLRTWSEEGLRGGWQERMIFLQARICEKQGDCESAVTSLRTYLDRYPSGHKATDATLLLGECLIRLGRQNEALVILEPLAARQDLSGTMASLRLGRAYRELGDADKSLAAFQQLSEGTVPDSLKARAMIEKGITLDAEGRYEDAVTALALADSLGKTALLGEAQYRIGLVSEKGLGDLDKAAAAYDQASKAQSPFGKLAAKRGAALKAMAKCEEALADTAAKTVDTEAMNRFMLAETYLHDLGLPAKALEQYTILSDSMARNPYSARAMLATGSLLGAKGDTSAFKYYRAVIDSFPATVYANVARSELGLPLVDVVVAVQDTAHADSSDTTMTVPQAAEVGPPAPGDLSVPSESLGVSGPDTTGLHEEPGSLAPGESLGVGGEQERGRERSTSLPQRPWERNPADTAGTSADTTGLPGSDWGDQ